MGQRHESSSPDLLALTAHGRRHTHATVLQAASDAAGPCICPNFFACISVSVLFPYLPGRKQVRLRSIVELSSMEKKLAEFKCNTNEAIDLKLVRFPDDLEDENTTFHPEYTHQLFGDDEIAFGYKGLQIFLYYTAGNLSPLFRLQYTSKVDEKFDTVQADDVESKIREIIPPVFCTNMDDFISLLEKEVNFRPFGTILHTYSVHNEEAGEDITYQICKADMTCPGFREYHERLQTFLMLFIETASFIDVDDERWDYFLVFEKYNKDGATLFATVGYMTVYNYYVYPDKTRPRVSQMLVLPPFQGEGHGAQLLESVHRYYISSPKVMDITAEDPSENYVKLRDFVLVKLCQDLPCFSNEKLFQGFSKEMVMETQQKLKINKQHCRRIYEILRMRVTDMSDTEKARLYRLDIKRRLIGPFKKNQRELAKMRKCLKPEELTNQMNQIDLNMQHEQLEESYQQLISDYRRVIERLAQA
ncbi:histone acetyltransferase type B catalytic subunit isoform X2 [Microcaecilia unicolor]|uniref:Histone acetyltransferase type B catalytic subunit n=1 Tax=Microcaecilia unicolor TaxID=1415580 RepID=A0A6P7YK84_9AMPH|nr:histone acetyltransferase type B catalytic subunit isoform X2 [Microcaecilia unicolor]